ATRRLCLLAALFSDFHARNCVASECLLRLLEGHSLLRTPTIVSIVTFQTVLHYKCFSRIKCLRVNRETSLHRIRVHAFSPAVSQFLVQGAASKLKPRPVKESAELVHA